VAVGVHLLQSCEKKIREFESAHRINISGGAVTQKMLGGRTPKHAKVDGEEYLRSGAGGLR
jgi:hypothetical protein